MQYKKSPMGCIGGYIEVDSAYIWDPSTLVSGIKKENILGIETPLWGDNH